MDQEFQVFEKSQKTNQDSQENKKSTSVKRKKNITNAMRGLPHFTHFMSLPFIRQDHRKNIKRIQDIVNLKFQKHEMKNCLRQHSNLLGHITLFMMTLKRQESRIAAINLLKNHQKQINEIIAGLTIKMSDVKYFTRVNKSEKCDQVTVIYLDLDDVQAQKKLGKVIDFLIRSLLKQQILIHEQLKSMHIVFDHNQNLFKAQALHMSLFRCNDLMVKDKTIEIFKQINDELYFKQKQKKVQFSCDYLDASTMQHEPDQDGFYHPLIRIILQNKEKQ